MSLNAAEYNSANSYFFDLAKKLVGLVNQYEKEKYFATIVDIGVGSGNITEMMAKSLEHGIIYGFDVDTNMLEFANHGKTIDTIEYLKADLSCDWNSLNQKISNLESKVSLVFSNMCIDLIREKSTFVQNVKKLLKEKRRAFFSFPVFPDITLKLKAHEKDIYERYVKVLGTEGQVQIWTNLFEQNGFKIEHKEFENPIWRLRKKDVLALLQFFPIILDTYTQGNRFQDLPEDLQEKYLSLSMDGFCNWTDKSVNWHILDHLKDGKSDEEIDCYWKIVYLVCKLD